MITDLVTVVWKEWRSVSRGSSRRQLVLSGLLLAMWAVLFPLQMGRDWVTDPVPMGLLGFALPVVIVGTVVPDAVAGERERRTLSTLLASRLPDRAILYGKLGFAVAIGWLSVPLILAIALVTVNLSTPAVTPLVYDAPMAGGVLFLALLTAILTGAIGVFFSLRSATTQDAQQLTVLALMFPMLVIGMGLTAVGAANPEFRRTLGEWIASVGLDTIVLGAMAILVLLDGALVAAADRRFRRGRLLNP
jgi:ABC-2 type transport system permease protein